jgi:hypothetical protein
VVAAVGDVDSAKGPALYFEIRHQGKPVDPWLGGFDDYYIKNYRFPYRFDVYTNNLLDPHLWRMNCHAEVSAEQKKLLLVLWLLLLPWLPLSALAPRRRCDAKGGKEYEYIGLFTDVMTIVKKSYVEEVDSKKLIYGAINGMLSALDPHSSFMSPDTFKEMKVETKGAFGGLGIEISMKEGILTVISPIEDTPAQRAGIKAGDQILKD